MSGAAVPGAGRCIEVAHGRVTGHLGVRFGGVCCMPAARGKPAWLRVAVRYETTEFVAELQEGQSLHIEAQTWRLYRIDTSGRSWHATLIRI